MQLSALFLYSSAYITFISLAIFIVFVLYYWYEVHPYLKLPSYHLDFRILYWILRRRFADGMLKNYAFQKLTEAAQFFHSEGLFTLWLGKPYVCIFGEEIVKIIINEPAAVDKPGIYKILEYSIGNGIFTSNKEEWKKQRKVINPALHGLILKDKTERMNENAETLVKQLRETKGHPTDDFVEIVKCVTLRIFFETTIGMKLEKLKSDELIKRLADMESELCAITSSRIFNPLMQWDFLLPFYPTGRKLIKLNKEVKQLVNEVLEELRESMLLNKANGSSSEADSDVYGLKRRTFAESLMEEHFKNSDFTMEDLYYQFTTLIIGGFETMSYTMMWCLFLLGLHPEIQEQAYNEIISETDGDIKFEDIRNLTYMECIIKETLRIYPAAPLYGRLLRRDLECGKYKIPKNSTLVIFIHAIHRNPDIYPDPEKFEPGRFMDGITKDKPWVFIPFAESVRPCVGKTFAMKEMTILLCHILRNFKVVSLDRREDVILSWDIVLTSTKRPRMQFVPRQA